jgi:hypothetical protein
MRKAIPVLLLLLAGVSQAAVVVGSPDIPSMDPFCAS